MRVVSKTDSADHVFSAISKEEVGPISQFLASKNVRLKNEMEDTMDLAGDMDLDDLSDDDDASIPSEDEGRKKKKGKKAEKVQRARVPTRRTSLRTRTLWTSRLMAARSASLT
jgi:structure-specific recognition protein 1